MAEILIVDDQPEILRVLRRILEGEGHAVKEASDGRAALTQVRAHPFDLVLTDLFMPDLDGIELLLELKEAMPGVKVVAMSGGGSILPRDQILEYADILGADSLLKKPFQTEEVLEAVDTSLGNGNVIPFPASEGAGHPPGEG